MKYMKWGIEIIWHVESAIVRSETYDQKWCYTTNTTLRNGALSFNDPERRRPTHIEIAEAKTEQARTH